MLGTKRRRAKTHQSYQDLTLYPSAREAQLHQSVEGGDPSRPRQQQP